MNIPFARPWIDDREIAAVGNAMRSGWLTTGPLTKEFEHKFTELLGRKHAIAVNSATAGLHLCLDALGVGPGDYVVTSNYTFTASAEVIRYMGATPLLLDVDPDTKMLDLNLLKAVLSKHKVKCVIPVHFAGAVVDMDTLLSLSEQWGFSIVEDAAHALPSYSKNRLIGSFGHFTVFSFYATKTLATGEGGMIVCSDDAAAERMRTMRLHGINRDVFNRYSSESSGWFYEVVAPGFKYNMTDLAAAIGLVQFDKLFQMRDLRLEISKLYSELLTGLPLKFPYRGLNEAEHSWHLYTVELLSEELNRDSLINFLKTKGVGASVHFIPLHRHPYWRESLGLRDDDYPVSTDLFKKTLSLPIYPGLTSDNIKYIANCIREYFNCVV